MSEIGVILLNKTNGNKLELWFEDEQEMNLHLAIYDKNVYEVHEYISDQQMMIFDDDIQ